MSSSGGASASDSKNPGAGLIAAVTGASGYVAGVLIKNLTEQGFKVRGTVRSLANKDKVSHLTTKFPDLELFEADLLDEGSFATVFQGVDYVFHTASPNIKESKNPQEEIVDPAVKGTENVIKQAFKTPGIKRIVFTSSLLTLKSDTKDEDYLLTADDWGDSTIVTNAYAYSKILAEKRAWELYEEYKNTGANDTSLVVVAPGFVLGAPVSTRTDSNSVRMIIGLLAGAMKDACPPFQAPFIDADDVARAHILAATHPDAKGRYLVTAYEKTVPFWTFVEILKAEFPNNPLPKQEPAKYLQGFRVDNSRVNTELGLEYTPVETTLKRMGDFLVENGLAKRL